MLKCHIFYKPNKCQNEKYLSYTLTLIVLSSTNFCHLCRMKKKKRNLWNFLNVICQNIIYIEKIIVETE